MKSAVKSPCGSRKGFTLIELVVVVLVMGILAAVAAPKMFDTASNAKVNSGRQSLSVLRDAIELHKAQNGVYPGDLGVGTDLADDLQPFLKGPFPKLSVPGAPGDGSVIYETDGGGLGAATGLSDWLYDNVDGSLKINVAAYETY
ncbi:Type II secretion system protein G precursor [Maioricimonas rarisocia]|uniref:Type II secretion system protein G n=1 Tax=Maioricimonas rarisocia TaxID=2528026 RepID=A0A517ZCA6_9PLAN|nr:prepilin-type N-terminal cleavage/methylation domain-containing protein [Maioricimonas rarisocia]QDU40133.1 Type II secretion system protein G precursor [Maioricimonas rarisocia]